MMQIIVALFRHIVLEEFVVLDAVERPADIFDFDEVAVLVFDDQFAVAGRAA